jgi:hypothetical protein
MAKESLELLEAVSISALFVFSAILVIGLICESKRFGEHIQRIGETLVILGVAGEMLADGGIFFSSGRLRALDETRIAVLNRQAETLKADNLKFERMFGSREIIVDDAFRKLKKFAGVSLWVQTVPSTDLPTEAELEKMDPSDVRGFALTFGFLRWVGWKFKNLHEVTENPDLHGVEILSFRPFPGKAWPANELEELPEMPSVRISPYNAPLDTPEERGWYAAEALKEYLRSDVGLGTTSHLALDNLKGEPQPPFDKLNPPHDVVILEIGYNNRELNLELFELEKGLKELKEQQGGRPEQ